jgi:hypothetical protein
MAAKSGAGQVVTRAFEITDRDGMFAWVVRRTDGKYALAAHTDVSEGDALEDAVVEGTVWHKRLAAVRREVGMKRNPPSGFIPCKAVKITRNGGKVEVRIRK